MATGESDELLYKRVQFTTRLPRRYLYSPSHYWMHEENGVWRVGFTRFATRMLGEIVDHGFGVEPGATVQTGLVVGWIEGFKAISDLFSPVAGHFRGGNAALKEDLEIIDRDCYRAGWLFSIEGQPGDLAMDAEAYKGLLDKTIDKMLEKQQGSGISE